MSCSEDGTSGSAKPEAIDKRQHCQSDHKGTTERRTMDHKKIKGGPTAGARACKRQHVVLFLLGVEHPLAASTSDEALVTTASEGAELQICAVAGFPLTFGERHFGPN